jgi:putative transposase
MQAMKIVDPVTGASYLAKRRQRFDEPGQPRELTFSCYRRFPFLQRERTREWFRDALQAARAKFDLQIWAYVLMPEHVHLLVYPGDAADSMSRFLQAVKEPVGRNALAYLRAHAPSWLPRLRVREGQRLRHRFWQPGVGYDRNITSAAALRAMIDYFHANPVRRGLVASAEDWEWSSARWFAGIRPVKIEMDDTILVELARDGVAGNLQQLAGASARTSRPWRGGGSPTPFQGVPPNVGCCVGHLRWRAGSRSGGTPCKGVGETAG